MYRNAAWTRFSHGGWSHLMTLNLLKRSRFFLKFSSMMQKSREKSFSLPFVTYLISGFISDDDVTSVQARQVFFCFFAPVDAQKRIVEKCPPWGWQKDPRCPAARTIIIPDGHEVGQHCFLGKILIVPRPSDRSRKRNKGPVGRRPISRRAVEWRVKRTYQKPWLIKWNPNNIVVEIKKIYISHLQKNQTHRRKVDHKKGIKLR